MKIQPKLTETPKAQDLTYHKLQRVLTFLACGFTLEASMRKSSTSKEQIKEQLSALCIIIDDEI